MYKEQIQTYATELNTLKTQVFEGACCFYKDQKDDAILQVFNIKEEKERAEKVLDFVKKDQEAVGTELSNLKVAFQTELEKNQVAISQYRVNA